MNDLPAGSAGGFSREDRGVTVVDAVAQIPQARREVGLAGSDAGLSPAAVERLTVATHEILTNAIVHGGGEAQISVEVDDTCLVVTIADAGTRWSGAVPAVRPDAQQLGGRGLWLAKNLCDDLTIAHCSAGASVRLVMNLLS